MSEEAEAVSLVLVTNKPLSACFCSIFQLSVLFSTCFLSVSLFIRFFISNIASVDFKKSTIDINSLKCFGAWTTKILLLFIFLTMCSLSMHLHCHWVRWSSKWFMLHRKKTEIQPEIQALRCS